MNNMEMVMRVSKVATLRNAMHWNTIDEKFTFCLDMLELCLSTNGDQFCDYWIEHLEAEFLDLLYGRDIGESETDPEQDFYPDLEY